jgi:hypothetical protein
MGRPLPSIPRGAGRRAVVAPQSLLMGCPRISPEWELAALRALMKPQLKGAILHRAAAQRWPRDAGGRIDALRREVAGRTGFDPLPHLPPDGDYHLICAVAPSQEAEARAFALALSKQFRQTWFVIGRLFVRDQTFWRRRFATQLTLVRASNVHLPRELRSLLKGII